MPIPVKFRVHTHITKNKKNRLHRNFMCMFVFFMQPTSESINFEKGNENKRKMIQSDVQ